MGVVYARTEEDQQASSASNTNGITEIFPGLSEQCFYRPPSDCPDINTDCPCKKINLSHNYESDAILCCNLDNHTFEYGFSCVGEHN